MLCHTSGRLFLKTRARKCQNAKSLSIFPFFESLLSSLCFQAIVLITDGSSVTFPQGLASISKSLKEAGIKVVVVVVGDAEKGVTNVLPLASGDKFILVVGSPNRLKIKVQETVDKILLGKKKAT